MAQVRSNLASDWDGFNTLRIEERRLIFDALYSERRPMMLRPVDGPELTEIQQSDSNVLFISATESESNSPEESGRPEVE